VALASFDEVQFPPNISAGAQGGPGFNTGILTLDSGLEHRNINWSRERPTYDVSTGIKTIQDAVAYQKFFYARRGRAIGFRFKDWSDYRLPFWDKTPGDIDPIPVFFITDGHTDHFQVYKVYSAGGTPFQRKITKLVQGTVNLFHNATPIYDTPGDVGGDYQTDHNTGVITLSPAIWGTTGHEISGFMEFDVPVRFDTDTQNLSLNGNELIKWDSITVIGLKL
jgi:uncharacterized protein (TIGR02217 family)